MIVVRNIEDLRDALAGTCLTIGNFDGVHRGHAKLIERVREQAANRDLLGAVVTFDPHPRRVLLGKKDPPFITLTEQKLELIEALGVEITALLAFNKNMAALEPEDFVRDYLVEGLAMKELIIGYDYAFGRGRKGNFELLARLGKKYGYAVERLDPVIVNDAVVSSTRIRDLVQAGRVWDARPLMNRFYQVRGAVVRGRDRGGRLLGFPTANLNLSDELVPLPGVYAVWTEVNGEIHPGVANIGVNPTFGNDAQSVEVHILDFSGDIYDNHLRVHFVQRLRAEKKFSGIDELAARIREDIKLGRRILAASEAAI